jgi:hypothetical protein
MRKIGNHDGDRDSNLEGNIFAESDKTAQSPSVRV